MEKTYIRRNTIGLPTLATENVVGIEHNDNEEVIPMNLRVSPPSALLPHETFKLDYLIVTRPRPEVRGY